MIRESNRNHHRAGRRRSSSEEGRNYHPHLICKAKPHSYRPCFSHRPLLYPLGVRASAVLPASCVQRPARGRPSSTTAPSAEAAVHRRAADRPPPPVPLRRQERHPRNCVPFLVTPPSWMAEGRGWGDDEGLAKNCNKESGHAEEDNRP